MKFYDYKLLLPACANSITFHIFLHRSLGQAHQHSDSEHCKYFISWYQQQPRKIPRHVIYVNNDRSHPKGDGIPD
jgi:hypothetical protein